MIVYILEYTKNTKMLYSFNGNYPEPIPERIVLSSGDSRTDSSTFTEEELVDAGWVAVGNMPPHDGETEKVLWNGTSWQVIPLTEGEINEKNDLLWSEVRNNREEKIREVEWRIFRYQSQVRLGMTPVDDITKLDEYVQSLRDITSSTSNPSEVVWPTLED